MVEPARREAPARIVPLSLVDIGGADTAQGEVRLRCTGAEFEQLDPAEETLFPGDEGYGAYGDMWGPAVAWPYYAPAGMLPGSARRPRDDPGARDRRHGPRPAAG